MPEPKSPEGLLATVAAVSLSAFRPLERFLDVETRAGTVLLGATLAALVIANSAGSDLYFATWNTRVALEVGARSIDEPLLFWINDLLMAAFFLLVGLEIKRELLLGELNTARKAALPLVAAIGGMVAPALIYTAIASRAGPAGWGIPMATDIAFAIGVARALGARVPAALLVFLTAFAIADDLGAVAVIALFYGHAVDGTGLLAAAGVTAVLLAMNRGGIRLSSAYVIVGLCLWVAVLASGIHPTLAGVVVGLCVPATHTDRAAAFAKADAVIESMAGREGDGDAGLEAIEHHVDEAQSPLTNLEHGLHPYVAYVILPLFALANAGVDLRGLSLASLAEPVSIGIVVALLLGKPLGIMGASFVAIRAGVAELPSGTGWRHLLGAGVLGGIGFTMSLFVAGLAFEDDVALHAQAKLGILLGSVISAVVGAVILRTGGTTAPRGTDRT